jgi:osmotically-inducible protein OsmY
MARLQTFALAIFFSGACAAAQEAAPKQDMPTEQAMLRMARAIQKGILTLPNYGVFDWVTFSFNGYNVILKGQASRPTLKDSAERVVKDVEGVAAVENRIEVLPLSPNDDRIRAAVYARIYGSPQLSRYNPNRGTPIYLSPARIANGITNDPPIGYHPIHIIVKNGNVTLEGVVLNEGDRSIANLLANQTPGVFTVENELVTEIDDGKKAAKSGKAKK